MWGSGGAAMAGVTGWCWLPGAAGAQKSGTSFWELSGEISWHNFEDLQINKHVTDII